MPKLCESCGSYDPAPRLTAESRCPRCGVVYANLSQAPVCAPAAPAERLRRAAVPPLAASEPGADWPPLKPVEVWGSLAAVCVLFAIILFDDDGFVPLLDHANLAFHEAGHPLFGLLGSALGLYGGTLGQLVFPVVAAASFWRRRHAVGVALSGVWLFENFLNIARYMADARAQLLPLVGGGEHDWYHIFSRWGLLAHDTDIASATRTFGWLGMVGAMVWLWRRFEAERRAPKLRSARR
jgi:hypothetical protein